MSTGGCQFRLFVVNPKYNLSFDLQNKYSSKDQSSIQRN